MLCSFVWCWHCGIFSLREIASASLLARQITFFFSLILTPDFYLWFNRKFKEIRKVPKNRTAQKKTPAKFILMRIICTARYTCDGPEFSKDNCMRLHLFGGFFFPTTFFLICFSSNFSSLYFFVVIVRYQKSSCDRCFTIYTAETGQVVSCENRIWLCNSDCIYFIGAFKNVICELVCSDETNRFEQKHRQKKVLQPL